MSTLSDRFDSKVVRTPRSASGAEGHRGVFERLMEEHGEITALLLRVNSSSDEDVQKELYPMLRQELLAHETGECGVVYPFLVEYVDLSQLALAHAREAIVLKSAVTAMDVLHYDDARWKLGFKTLARLVREHFEEEESEFFPRAQNVIGAKNAEMLEVRYQESKSAIAR